MAKFIVKTMPPELPAKAETRLELFAREYVIGLNGTRAAIASGYSPNGAEVTASRLLRNTKVQRLINRLLAKRFSKLDLKAEQIIEELARLAFSNMMDYIRVNGEGDAYLDFSKLTRDQAAPIQEITSEVYTEGKGGEAREVKRTKFKLSDKAKSLELLGRHLKMFETEADGAKPEIKVVLIGADVRPQYENHAAKMVNTAGDPATDRARIIEAITPKASAK
jgi:phage terminase small subunit